MTYSIVAYDPETEELGVAVASKFLAAGAYVPYAKAGVGAVATQSFVNPHYGPDGLALMEQGKDVEEIIKEMTSNDEERSLRQVGIVNAKGESATFTGEECYSWAGGVARSNFACQGNILTGEEVITAMVKAFEESTGPLAHRLVAALKAGDDAGGDSRGKQSASLLVVKEKGGYGGANDRYIDLRVDDHEEPVAELARLLHLHDLYFKPVNEEDIMEIDEALREKITKNLQKLDLIKEDNPSDDVFFEALKGFQLVENFDERLQEDGYIDRLVLEYMDDLVKRAE